MSDKTKKPADPGFDIDKFKKLISDIESGGDYNVMNKSGSSATGKYQFVWSIWGDRIMAETGVSSKEEFLDDPSAQEEFMTNVVNNDYIPNIDKLRKSNPDKTASYTDAQLVALMHFQGLGGANSYLTEGTEINPENNIKVQDYLAPFSDLGVTPNAKVNKAFQEVPEVNVLDIKPDVAEQDFSVHGENTKMDNTIIPLPTSIPKVNTSFTGQGSKFNLGGNLFPDGGPLNTSGPTAEKTPVDESAMRAMMKARMATEAAFGNPSALRMTSPNPKTYDFGNGETGTHFMSSYGKYAVPQLQDKGGDELTLFEGLPPYSPEVMKFETEEEAQHFAENYKNVAPMMNQFKTGGNLKNKDMFKYYATGGPMQGMPTDGSNGPLTEFNAGGLHEENPNGGIPQGMNPNGQQNLVEQGETKHNSKDYIFSDTLKVDKETAKEFYFPSKYVGKTFAEVSKLMNRPNSRRTNDSIENNAKKKDLDALMNAQEEFKAKDLQKDVENMMSKHPDFMQSMMAPQPSPMEQAPVEPGMEQGMMDPNMIPPQTPMAKMGGYQNQMGFGGDLLSGVKNFGLGLADASLGVIGADNVIKDSAYSGFGADAARTTSKVAGKVGNVGAKVAANIIAPGVGGAVMSGVENMTEGLGGANTKAVDGRIVNADPNGLDKGLDILGNVATTAITAGMQDDNKMWNGGGLKLSNKYGSDYSTGINLDNPYLKGNALSNSTLLSGYDSSKPDYGYGLSENNNAQKGEQSLLNAVGTYAPALYNIGQGLFGKVDKINADDYINDTKLENFRDNVNPQLRATDEAIAGARKQIRNSGAGGGSYLANLQALHSKDAAAKAGIEANAENNYNARQLQLDQMNAARGDQNAMMRLQINQMNQQAKAAKQRMLQEGLKQTGEISQSKTANDLATMYNNMYAPDFKDYASYQSYADKLAAQMKTKFKK